MTMAMQRGRTSRRRSTAGAPWISLNQDGTRYFDYHHTPDDTLDKIDPAQLRQNVAAWTTVLAMLSGGIESEPKRQSAALSLQKRRKSMRILIAIPALAALGRLQRLKEGNAVTVQYDQNTAENTAADVGNTAQNIANDIGNDVKTTGDKIQNTDVNIKVGKDEQTNSHHDHHNNEDRKQGITPPVVKSLAAIAGRQVAFEA